MRKISVRVLMLCVLATPFAIKQASAQSIPVTVDCNKGQSLNSVLAELDKHVPTTVSVNGTCTEYVHVTGFQNLTLKGLPGAALVQPSTSPGNLVAAVLMIESSQSVTVAGFNLEADTTISAAIGVGHGSSDIRLRNLTVEGGGGGIIIFEHSQASLAYVTAKDPGYCPLCIYDLSDVHVEHCRFENTSGQPWHAGVDLGASHLTIYDTAIKNMQIGINAYAGSDVDVLAFDTYYPYSGSPEVTITGSAGTNYDGVSLVGKSSLNVIGVNPQATKLVINDPGQSYGGTTAGVLASDGSVIEASSGLVITGSRGQGVAVMNNSHATLTGATITGSVHGGLAASNLSSIDVGAATTSTLVSGNGVDLFCDSDSTITGSANVSGATVVKCANLLSAEFTLP
jgi:hypothetical protein